MPRRIPSTTARATSRSCPEPVLAERFTSRHWRDFFAHEVFYTVSVLLLGGLLAGAGEVEDLMRNSTATRSSAVRLPARLPCSAQKPRRRFLLSSRGSMMTKNKSSFGLPPLSRKLVQPPTRPPRNSSSASNEAADAIRIKSMCESSMLSLKSGHRLFPNSPRHSVQGIAPFAWAQPVCWVISALLRARQPPGSSACWRMNRAAFATQPAQRLVRSVRRLIRRLCRVYRQKAPQYALPLPGLLSGFRRPRARRCTWPRAWPTSQTPGQRSPG